MAKLISKTKLVSNTFNASFFFFSIISIFIVFTLVNGVNPKYLLGVDMRAFYTGGVMLNRGVGAHFYDLSTQYIYQKTIFPELTVQSTLSPFDYPPFVASLFLPLSLLSVKNAYVIFALTNIFLALSIFYLLIRQISKTVKGKKYILSFFFILLYFPFLEAILQGQITFFLLLGIVSSWYCFKYDKRVLAGVSLSLFLIKPHLIIVPLFLIVWKKQWRALFGMSLSTGFLALVSAYEVGFSGLVGYVKLLLTLLSVGEGYTVHPRAEPTIRGFLQLIFHTDKLSFIILPLTFFLLIAFVLFIFSWKGKFDPKAKKFDIQWSVLVITILVTSLHMNYHDLILFIFPCIILLTVFKRWSTVFLLLLGIDFIFLELVNKVSLLGLVLFIFLGIFTYFSALSRAKRLPRGEPM